MPQPHARNATGRLQPHEPLMPFCQCATLAHVPTCHVMRLCVDRLVSDQLISLLPGRAEAKRRRQGEAVEAHRSG
jgi:hypothetical protein